VNYLIIVGIHQRDVIDNFVRDSVLSADEFAWQSQLRFYWDQALDDLQIRQCGGSFDYGYEYLGLSGRLVVTPLTVRCVMTLTQALSHRLGGAPAGPAGTGKTETVKDLARQLGIFCKVYCCGENTDYTTTGGLLSGLVQVGGWGCFDEFNRILPEVLSVISIQISTIQHAFRQSLRRFQFFGKEMPLDTKCGIFITMNPGYAGRSELPDNLKALFRPVVMVVPDMELITEVILNSQGFTNARGLAKKTSAMYALARQQLSAQNHYDWGLRALKSVLGMAGTLKRAAAASGGAVDDAAVLVKAIQGMNLPKLVQQDIPIFKGILRDLF
jgi:dynein heavy chain